MPICFDISSKMKINEIFYSIQGEGKWTGLPNIFIRTTGCNLRCSFCDTKFAYNDGKEMTVKQVIDKIKKYPCKYICLTGGEPLIQNEIYNLIDSLLEENYRVCLETNGSKNIENISKNNNILISLDIKCPSSNMQDKNYLKNINYLREKDQLKFVIGNKEDYEYAKKIIKNYKPKSMIFFQPVWGKNPKELSKWILKDGVDVKLGLQLHKILWGNKRGV